MDVQVQQEECSNVLGDRQKSRAVEPRCRKETGKNMGAQTIHMSLDSIITDCMEQNQMQGEVMHFGCGGW